MVVAGGRSQPFGGKSLEEVELFDVDGEKKHFFLYYNSKMVSINVKGDKYGRLYLDYTSTPICYCPLPQPSTGLLNQNFMLSLRVSAAAAGGKGKGKWFSLPRLHEHRGHITLAATLPCVMDHTLPTEPRRGFGIFG